MDEKSSSAVSDPKVAAFYDFVVKSNKFYCQKDLEALMKKHEIKSSRYKEVIQQLIKEGLLRSERFKNVIITWATRDDSNSDTDNTLELLEWVDARLQPSSRCRVERVKLQAMIEGCQSKISDAESSLGNEKRDCIDEKCSAIQSEIEVLNQQVEVNRKDIMRCIVEEMKMTEDSIMRSVIIQLGIAASKK
ncbi:hypothetical protein X943_002207 [Babesia divergens]|uniref:Mnd1 HTH domain-containing protein n=1 Tax=Babesia divergens TaxID=32595 RepID=A0AAD9GD73_BABDI|nr:hypothetical protein X943_002207 [Babesia divergens]